MPPESITLIERYGSFGLLCVIALATLSGIGWGAWYLTARLLPRVFEHLKGESDERQKQRDAYTAELKVRDERAAKQHAESTEVLRALVDEVKGLGEGAAACRNCAGYTPRAGRPGDKAT